MPTCPNERVLAGLVAQRRENKRQHEERMRTDAAYAAEQQRAREPTGPMRDVMTGWLALTRLATAHRALAGPMRAT